MRQLISVVIMAFGWVLIFSNSTDKFLSSVGGFILMFGAVLNWG